MKTRRGNNSGMILLAAAGALVLMTLLVSGLGYRGRVETALLKNRIAALRARYAAVAGLSYVLALTHEHQQTQGRHKQDILRPCGSTDEEKFCRELLDEGSKININAISFENAGILKTLLEENGVPKTQAETIASSVVDWRDENTDVFHEPYGAEDTYYLSEGRTRGAKNGPFDSLEELMLVRDMSPGLFRKIKMFVTVFPRRGKFKINIDAASTQVLFAVARDMTGGGTHTRKEDAQSLVSKIISFRRGPDGLSGTPDDRVVDFLEMSLTSKEDVLARLLERKRMKNSRFLTVSLEGTDKTSGAKSRSIVILDQEDMCVVRWREGELP